MKPAFGPRYFEDPTVSRTCALEYNRLWRRIGTKVQGGAWFYRAREVVLAEEIPDIAKAYGKPVADRVQRAIQQTDPTTLPKSAKAAQKDDCRRTIEAHLLATRGRIGWFNRMWLRMFGVHFA